MNFTTEHNELSDILRPRDNQVQRIESPLPISNGVIWILNGMKGSGKSTLMINSLSKGSPYFQQYDKIYFCSPTAEKDSKLAKLVGETKQNDNYYNEFHNEIMCEILEKIKEFNEEYIKAQEEDSEDDEDPVFGKKTKKKKSKKPRIIRQPHSLLILDDCIHAISKSSKDNYLNQIITQSRHFKTDVWITTQKYNKLPTIIRTNADLLTVFPTNNSKEFETIENDWSIDPKLLKEVYDFAISKEPNSFLHISFFSGKPTFYQKFNKIISS